jgi:hypothetical protein
MIGRPARLLVVDGGDSTPPRKYSPIAPDLSTVHAHFGRDVVMPEQFPGRYVEVDAEGQIVGEPFAITFRSRRANTSPDHARYEVERRSTTRSTWLNLPAAQVRARLASGRWRHLDADDGDAPCEPGERAVP